MKRNKEKENKLTHKELTRLLEYSSSTGEFKWKVSRQRMRAGSIAGWNLGGYKAIKINGETYLAHRVAWFYINKDWPREVDHINQNKSDNRIENLRDAGRFLNYRNRPLQANNKSGTVGVNFIKKIHKWQAYISLDGDQEHLGIFDDMKDAMEARKQKEKEYGYHKNHGRIKYAI
jgi:hypothetical protein